MSRLRTNVEVLRPRRERRRGAEQVVAAVRPRGVGEILDTAFDVFAVRFAACLGLAALLWFPIRLVETVVVERASREVAALLMAVPMVVEFLTVAFVARLVREQLQGGHLGAFQAMAGGLSRMPGLIVIGFGTGILVALTWVCCFCSLGVIPLVVTWLFSVAPAVYVLERVTLPEAVVRSTQLVRSSFPRFSGWFLLKLVMVMPIAGLAVAADDPDVEAALRAHLPLGEASYLLVLAAVSSLFAGLATAYSAVAMTVYYVDTRTRSEGFDLRLRLERLARARAEPA